MSSSIITGHTFSLAGEVDIHGSKNAALPVIIASLLIPGKTIFHNCPDISDVNQIIEVLKKLGGTVIKEDNTLIIDAGQISCSKVDKEIASKTRGSILFLGALLSRCKEATIAYPGGCSIGKRPINYHIDAMKKLGVVVESRDEELYCKADSIRGSDIYLEFPSVGTTENIILASTLARGTTTIYHPALEPEIICLCRFLNRAGAKIEVRNNCIIIEGVTKLKECEFKIPFDRIVAGTYMAAVAAVGGEASFHYVNQNDLQSVILLLENMGCSIHIEQEVLHISRLKELRAPDKIVTEPFPGFPTDLQSQFMVVLSQAKNDSVMIEKIFDDRFKTIQELNKLGAHIENNENMAFIHGNRKLIGTFVKATDLRGGAALVIAGLAAFGETTISNIDYIERGYVDIVKDFKCLGAQIEYGK